MNLDFDFSAVPRFFTGLMNELRQKRLWPVAVVLVVAIVAVPFLLGKSGSATPAPVAQVPTPRPVTGASIPTLNVQSTTSKSRLYGTAHDPFAAGATTAATPHALTTTVLPVGSPSVGTATSSTPSTTSGGASSNASSGAASSGSSSGVAPTSNPPSITHGATPKPAPTGLKSTQAYDVSLAITDSAGGIDTTDPLERDSVIPNAQQPLLVELGVAQDGNHVLFAVLHGAVPTGPGKCTPGPIDCEILSLGQDQTEQLSAQQGSVGPAQVALFAITGITAADYSSSAAADNARRAASAGGQALLDAATYPTLSLFRYEPSRGSVVDLRTLGVS